MKKLIALCILLVIAGCSNQCEKINYNYIQGAIHEETKSVVPLHDNE